MFEQFKCVVLDIQYACLSNGFLCESFEMINKLLSFHSYSNQNESDRIKDEINFEFG